MCNNQELFLSVFGCVSWHDFTAALVLNSQHVTICTQCYRALLQPLSSDWRIPYTISCRDFIIQRKLSAYI